MSACPSNVRPPPDRVIADIAEYVDQYQVRSKVALETAHYCFLDLLGCALAALSYPECTKLLGPVVIGTIVPNGARVPGTPYVLDPIQAIFNIGALVRWLEFNDATWGETVSHPSDTFSALLVTADWLSRTRVANGRQPLRVGDLWDLAVKAYEIQGQLGIDNPFRRLGLDHTIVVKIASAATITKLLGGSRNEIVNAVSNAWLDGHALATFRSAPNTGSRKSWAGGDVASRGAWLALLAMKGEMGYPSALTAKTWGFYDVLFKGKPFTFARPYGSFIIENILFKVPYPTAFHAQTAVEAAIKLHATVKERLDAITKIEIWSHASSMMILDKTGPLHNPADRDHSLQYTTAIGMIYGRLTPADYEDTIAADPRIDALRARMVVREDKRYTRGYLDPVKRTNAHAIRVQFEDGSRSERVEVEYPLGHRRRRREGLPCVIEKFERGLAQVFAGTRRRAIREMCLDRARLSATPVNELFDLLAK
ncbi:MAG: bifunctional 2-methylcitrate dehydratase/aconitate hydratase [Betaproteobacteria bacterium]|nr:bifunctional 2-methylcitrate dehydratase/aconitate hydratase [Betaproteobacteria bacterium]